MSGDCRLIRYQSMKTREIADTPEKGQKRYWLYRSVIDRYNEAYKSGYYLEAITLMESLITDRLESLLVYHGLITPNKAFMTLGSCINIIRRSQEILSEKLIDEIDEWKNSRNHALHEMAKIEEGDSAVFNQRYVSLQSVAQKGYVLFNSIKKEA